MSNLLDNPADEMNDKPSGGGPRTPEGKARSSMNALKTGLTGHTVLLPTDDLALYEEHLQRFAEDLQPVGPRENQLVQKLADHEWRLMRVSALEMTIYACGHDEFEGWFDHRPPELRHDLIQFQTFMRYEKQLRNLQIQEMRLRRNVEKDTASLQRLQRERLGTSGDVQDPPQIRYRVEIENGPNPNLVPPSSGTAGEEFDFSSDSIAADSGCVVRFIAEETGDFDRKKKPSRLPEAA